MKYVLINHAEDGTHNRVFDTEAKAIAALEKFFGRKTNYGVSFQINRSYISDFGNRLIIEERADDWSAKLEEDIREAFDARECGYATEEQLALLEKHNY